MNPATNDSTGVTLTYSKISSFIKYNGAPFPGTIEISPPLTDFLNLGTNIIGISITASQGSIEYTMSVIVTNSAPIF